MVGRLGTLSVRLGYYVYVGSAFGPGGLAARIARHAKRDKKPHWHIDYLTALVSIEELWYTVDKQRRECQWADLFSRMHAASVPLAGFGSSDCVCLAHLCFLASRPSWRAFRQRLRAAVPDHGRIGRWRPESSLSIRPVVAIPG